MDKMDYKFLDRKMSAIINKCRFCEKCTGLLAYYTCKNPDENNNFCDLSTETKYRLVLSHRRNCAYFHIKLNDKKERDTTYPTHNFSPYDNGHDHLLDDNSMIDTFDGYDILYKQLHYEISIDEIKSSCTSYFPMYKNENTSANNWDECVEQLFKMGRILPSNSKVIELLHTSYIPSKTHIITVPRYNFSKGLFIDYKKGLIDFTKEKNALEKKEMKKVLIVHLYHEWFKKIEESHKEGIFMALLLCKPFSLARDLTFWMTKVFKDEIALANNAYKTQDEKEKEENELEIEFIPMSLLDKAQQAIVMNTSGCNPYELDIEEQAYEELINSLGYNTDDDIIYDRNGHKISDEYNTLKLIY